MPECNECRKERQGVPFIVHEADMARMERTIKRLWILLLVLVVLLVGTNIAWIAYESQFVEETITEIEQDADGNGNNYIVGGDYNGEANDTSH